MDPSKEYDEKEIERKSKRILNRYDTLIFKQLINDVTQVSQSINPLLVKHKLKLLILFKKKMATNTNGITTFWDFASWYIDKNIPASSGNEGQIAYILATMFITLDREVPEGATVDDMKLLGQECPTKDEIEALQDITNAYINNASSYASNQLIKYSDLRYEKVEDSITVTPSSLSFIANPRFHVGATNLTVVSSGDWSAENTTEAGTISPSSGSAGTTKVLFNPGENLSTFERLGRITFTCGSASDVVDWTQEAATTFSISPTFVSLPATGAATANNVTVTCPDSWTVSTSDSWINLSRTSGVGNGSLTVSADINTSIAARNGTVTFTRGVSIATATLRVYQLGQRA